ncbi:hypothetical protein OG357_27865 [Streptomyces sp. NBC_01255]|uniref:DUF6571 family protein n=1 Tax=Streptomyces sp. NBC_01255 TaxID=2903798 RepID=UPI002E3108A4|nr:DUF6571 family protein [Streptomyces sp. NBC_01255]
MTLGFDDVLHAPLGKLKEAVTDWTQMAAKLETLARDARDGMKAKSDKARWEGVNASVTRPFIAKTAKEFDDAARSAKGVQAVLDQAYAAFEKARNDLRKIVGEEAPKLGVGVEPDGKVHALKPVADNVGTAGKHDPDYDGLVRKEQADLAHIERRIRAVLDEADEADSSFARTLKANMGSDPHDFSGPKFANPGEMYASRAEELARKGDRMTDAELKELRTLLHEHRESPEFTTAFYDRLGPERSLEFFADLTMKTDGDSKERSDSLKALQQDLGYSLATATDPDNKPHLSEQWQTELRRAGSGTIDVHPERRGSFNPSGYQVLSNILRYGEYDKRFLTPIAEHASQLRLGHGLHKPANEPYIGINLNPAGTDGSYGYNPMTGILEALGHSPEASKDFFDGKMIPYSDDGRKMDAAYFERVHGGSGFSVLDQYNVRQDGDGNLYLKDLKPSPYGEGGKTYTDYFDMFTDKDHPWPDDRSEGGPAIGDGDGQKAWDEAAQKAKDSGPDALGHALESAVTGRAYDDENAKPVKHSEEQAELMHRVVEKFGTEPGNALISVTGEGDEKKTGALTPLRDSLGNMTAEYMRDFQKVMGASRLETFGVDAGLDDGAARNFVSVVARDPDAYGAIINAQQATTSDALSGLSAHYAKGESQGGVADLREEVATFTKPGAVIAGIASEARADAVYIDKTAGDEDFNKGLQEGGTWVERGFGLAIKPLEASIVGAPAAWMIEDVKDGVLEKYERDTTGEGKDAADKVIGDQSIDSRAAARQAAVIGAQRAGLSWELQQMLGDSAYSAAETGFNGGVDNGRGYTAPPSKPGGN